MVTESALRAQVSLSWIPSSMQWCESRGLHLTEINDAAENDFLKDLVMENGRLNISAWHWIGLDASQNQENVYTWHISGW